MRGRTLWQRGLGRNPPRLNAAIEFRWEQGQYDRLPTPAAGPINSSLGQRASEQSTNGKKILTNESSTETAPPPLMPEFMFPQACERLVNAPLLLQTVARGPKFTGCRIACDDLGDRSTGCSNIPDACRK
jgi:hypothetical protein